ncbi:MAG: aminopeptidase [Flavobacteriaceae bacterium]
MKVRLDDNEHKLEITQQIKLELGKNFKDSVYWFHNWPNAYKSNKTALAERFLEDYATSFHFAPDKQKGYTDIHNIIVNGENVQWKEKDDVFSIPIIPDSSSLDITMTYTVYLPRDKFTGYGWSKYGYKLKYWYINPAVKKDGEWKIMSNLNLNDMFSDYQDFDIELQAPSQYVLFTDAEQQLTLNKNISTHQINAVNRQQIELYLSPYLEFEKINTASVNLITNMSNMDLDPGLIQNLADRQLTFLEQYLGPLDREDLLISELDYLQNPVYGFNQLPNFLAPFQNTFLWDVKFLKVLSKRYLEELVQYNKREDYWLVDAMQTWILMDYVAKYYPDEKALGGLTKLPFFKNYYLAQLSFNGKYQTVYQYIARRNLDQSLDTPADELSNFNRKITNKYKAGLGLNYLNAYAGNDEIQAILKELFSAHQGNYLASEDFRKELPETYDWFFDDYVGTDKQIDYKLKKISEDSIVVVKNKSGYAAPFTVTTLKKDQVINEYWKSGTITRFAIPKDSSDRIAINYEGTVPEVRLHDNWKKKGFGLSAKPIDFKLLKDLDDPNKNQIFYTPEFVYNYYDGITLGLSISNKTLLAQDFLFKVTPAYGFKSQSLTGSFGMTYRIVPKSSNSIRNIVVGASGSYFHYAPDLAYLKFSPYAGINFKRKSLRDVGGRSVGVSYVHVDKDPNPEAITTDEINRYGVVNFNYNYSKPALIDDLRYNVNVQWEKSFTKASLDLRYRRLTDIKRQLDFRIFVGGFLRNETSSDYFSFALDRPTNYLFNYNFLGTSETSGFFAQQIIIAEGGFKSDVGNPYANQWMTTFNGSVGIWRWVEFYGDVGFMKSRGQDVFFGYDGGMRLNFVHNILELYFPLYSNNGWETNTDNYAEKIRFVLTLNPGAILNFVRRGFI